MTTLHEALKESLARRFPSVNVGADARFMPMLDLSKGEISSTAAIEVAKALKGEAPRIAQSLIEDISLKVAGDWRVVAGYMVLSNVSRDVLFEESPLVKEVFSPQKEGAPIRTVVGLTPDATTPLYARIRLIACAAVQAMLGVAFEGRCRLGFSPEAPRIVTSLDDVVAVAVEAIERCFRCEGESRIEAAIPLEFASPEAPLVLWTSHHYHDRLSKDAKRAFVDLRLSGAGALKMPADGWLLSRDRALAELLSGASLRKVMSRVSSKEGWLRVLFHFASSTGSGDLDPAVSLYEECASPRWSLQVLSERVNALVRPHLPTSPSDLRRIVVSADLLERELSLRALFLPALTARALREGEILSWFTVLEEFASRSHAILNSPHFRVALKEGALSASMLQINASLALGVESILAVVTEEECVRHQQNKA
jgi:hypothetical protein